MIVLSLYKGEIEVKPDPRPAGGMRTILAEVARLHGLTTDQLLSPSRARHISHARHEFMWRCRQVKWADDRHRYSQPQIAAFLGMKDHTSVWHGEHAHARRMAEAQAAEVIAA